MCDFTNDFIKMIEDHLDRKNQLFKEVLTDFIKGLAICGFFESDNWKGILESSFNTSISAMNTSKIIEQMLANEKDDFAQVLGDLAKGFKNRGFFLRSNWNQILTTSFTNAQVNDESLHNEVEMETCSSECSVNDWCYEKTTNKRFCCDICGKTFSNKRGIRQHIMRIHTGKSHLHRPLINRTPSDISSGTALKNNGSSCKTVRISLENIQTVEYIMQPLERLMKCDESFYHFFCLLNCIDRHQLIVVKKMRLNKNKYCPFDCVLGIGNSIEKIISIIETNSDNLNKIKIDEQEEELSHTVEIDEYNILYLLNKLINQRYGCKEEICEIDDHGLLSICYEYLEINGLN